MKGAASPVNRPSRGGWTNVQVFLVWGLSCAVCLNLNSYRSFFQQADLGRTTKEDASLLPPTSESGGDGTPSDPLKHRLQEMMHSAVMSDPQFQASINDGKVNVDSGEDDILSEIYDSFQRVVEKKRGVACQPPTAETPEPCHCPTSPPESDTKTDDSSYRFSSKSTKYLSGMARIDRKEFLTTLDGGIPVNIEHKSVDKDVWILYGGQETLPKDPQHALEISQITSTSKEPPMISLAEATENCGQLGVLYVRENNYVGECTALVPGSVDALFVQKWLRSKEGRREQLDMNEDFRIVERGRGPKGVFSPVLPSDEEAIEHNTEHRKFLAEFFADAEGMMNELKPIIAPIAKDNQVVIFVVNPGQFEFLVNFACGAKSRGLSISHCVVFVSTPELKVMVEELGMAAYYNEKYFGGIPEESGHFGGKTFGKVVGLKQIGPYLVNALGYSFLFQDVDLVWYKDPLDFFNDPNLADPVFDMYFQDDNNQRIEQLPFRGNTGTYYVRNNVRTQKVFFDAIMRSDRLKLIASDQQAMAANLFENASGFGLRVKTFNGEETAYLPNGFHFHHKTDVMQAVIEQKTDAVSFHMNWAKEKKIKVKFMKQLGVWYVKEECEDVKQLQNVTHCCSAEPLVSCHFSNRASLLDCSAFPEHQRSMT